MPPRADSPWAAPAPALVAADGGDEADAPMGGWPATDWQAWANGGWCDWQPDEPLGDREFWREVAFFAAAWLASPAPAITAATAATYCLALDEARDAVQAGCRFNAEKWQRMDAELED